VEHLKVQAMDISADFTVLYTITVDPKCQVAQTTAKMEGTIALPQIKKKKKSLKKYVGGFRMDSSGSG
jgi:predicted secreted Zn-dependent protease